MTRPGGVASTGETERSGEDRTRRRLDRERRARHEAESIAERATRRLYREQQILAAILDVASTANDTDRITDSTRCALDALTTHTSWHCAHAFHAVPGDVPHPAAWLDPAGGDPARPPASPLTARARELLATAETVIAEFPEEPTITDDGARFCCACSICAGGRCYGVIEAFSERPDADAPFTRQLLEGLAQQLGYVYRREWDRHAAEHYAYHDPLTGIGNRLLFFDRLHHALRRADRSGLPVGLISLDVDDFKAINDGAGHAVGDAYLLLIAERLADTTRAEDTAARIGGDEFALVLEGLAPEAAGALIDRLMQTLLAPGNAGDTTITPCLSAGFAVYPRDAATVDELLHCADLAMYRAKALGGGRCEVHASAPSPDGDGDDGD